MAERESVDSAVKQRLDSDVARIEQAFEANGLGMVGPIRFGIDGLVRTALEAIPPASKKNRLAVVVDTPGGIVEVVERIVDVVRHHFAEVIFVVPDRAMSAGTVLAMSGDSIWMDYFSVLGPIDPQLERNGQLVPALAYLAQFDRLVAKASSGQLTTAEMVLLQKLDLAELQLFREARELSVELLKKWLVAYKFKDWTRRASSGQVADAAYKVSRAETIATVLSNHERWHSHGRGIPRTVLQSDELKLKIDDLGSKPGLVDASRSYVSVLLDYAGTRKLSSIVHTVNFF